jgi:hypothetical protein
MWMMHGYGSGTHKKGNMDHPPLESVTRRLAMTVTEDINVCVCVCVRA